MYIAEVRTQQQQKQAWYIQEIKEIRGVTENSANTEVGKIPSRRKGESHLWRVSTLLKGLIRR